VQFEIKDILTGVKREEKVKSGTSVERKGMIAGASLTSFFLS